MENTDYNTGTSQGQYTQPTGKKHDIITKYLSDMVAVEAHIYQAIDKQVKETQDEKDINPKLREIRDTLEGHVNSLRRRLDALGGQATNPIKEAGASILGVAAGLIDKIRAEEVSKDLRDDYTALGLANVSYVMLITTALACNDTETADLATRNLKDNARIVMDLGSLIPYAVYRDLSELSDLNEQAVDEARERYSGAWN